MPETGPSRRAVAVTGATGFLGRALSRYLSGRGWRVRAVVRPDSPRTPPVGSEPIIADLDRRQLTPAFADCSAVVHMAGLTRARSLEEYQRVNRDGARETARAAADAGARLILVSSQAAGGTGTATARRDEEDEPRPISDYGCSKLAGERVVSEIEGLEWSILRPVSVYGPGDRDFAALFRAAARGFGPLVNAPGTPYSLIYVDDLVAAMELALEQPAAVGETFFVGHPEVTTAEGIIRAFGAAAGRRPRLLKIPRWGLRLATEASALGGMVRGRPGLLTRSRYRELSADGFVCSSEKIRRLLGFEAKVDLATGARLSRAWYLQEESP